MRLSDHPRQKIAYQLLNSGRTVSYGELDDDSARGAQLFRKLGIEPGDGIAIWLPNVAEFLKITWAAQRAGIYYTPISTYFQASEVEYILQNSDAKLLITNLELLNRLETPPEHIAIRLIDQNCDADRSWLVHCSQQTTQPLAIEAEGSEMIYSSGTTGQPKGVRFPLSGQPYGSISATLQTRIDMHELSSESVYLSTAPLYHSAPLRYNMIVTRLGGTAYIMEKFDAEQALRTIDQYKISHSQWVPTMFVRLLKLSQQTKSQYCTDSLRFIIHAAAPCPVDVKRDMIDWFGPILYEYYSGTEANGFTAIDSQEWLEHPGSVGRPVSGTVHILDEAQRTVPAGQSGTVYFGGGNDFSYYKDPDKTAAAKTQEGLSTLGDIGYLDEEGYLYLQDRKSFMIISGGVNIYPQEIENLLISHPAVRDVAVFGVPNPEFEEEVKAVIETERDPSEDLAAELIAYCKANLSAIKSPKTIDFTHELPRHPTGKLYKQALKDRYWKLADS